MKRGPLALCFRGRPLGRALPLPPSLPLCLAFPWCHGFNLFFVRVSGELGSRFLAILRVRSGWCVSLAELMPRVYYSNLSCLVVKWTIYVLACRPRALWGLTNSETATFNWVHRPYLQAVYFKKSYRAFLGLRAADAARPLSPPLSAGRARLCHLRARRARRPAKTSR